MGRMGFIYNAVGKVDGLVTYRIDVAAATHHEAVELAKEFIAGEQGERVTWDVKVKVTERNAGRVWVADRLDVGVVA